MCTFTTLVVEPYEVWVANGRKAHFQTDAFANKKSKNLERLLSNYVQSRYYDMNLLTLKSSIQLPPQAPFNFDHPPPTDVCFFLLSVNLLCAHSLLRAQVPFASKKIAGGLNIHINTHPSQILMEDLLAFASTKSHFELYSVGTIPDNSRLLF